MGLSQQTSPFEYSCDLQVQSMTKKRNGTRKKKILTNSQDTNINATFTKTAFLLTKKIIETEVSCLKIDPVSCRLTCEEC